jgi:hypothetical protein
MKLAAKMFPEVMQLPARSHHIPAKSTRAITFSLAWHMFERAAIYARVSPKVNEPDPAPSAS